MDPIVRVDVRGEKSEEGKSGKGNARADASDRNVFGGYGQKAPDEKGEQCRNGSEGEEHAKGGENAFSSAESGKTREAVPDDREKTAGKRKPVVVGTSRSLGRFVEGCGNCRGKEAFEKIDDDHGESGFYSQNAKRIGQARVFRPVVPDVIVLSVDDFCDPDCGRNGAEEIR